jgi:Holliday junction DNA helicase RuvA
VYHHVRGRLCELSPTLAVVEAAGVGFRLAIPLSTSQSLRGKDGDEVLLYTHLLVREDDLRLFGFASTQERDVFILLESVSGVGPGTALQVLSTLGVMESLRSLASGDAGGLQCVRGVGKRIADRLVVELRDRAASLAQRFQDAGGDGRAARSPQGPRHGTSETALVEEATAALVELGYTRHEAKQRVTAAFRRLAGAGDHSTSDPVRVEALIRASLGAK